MFERKREREREKLGEKGDRGAAGRSRQKERIWSKCIV